MKFGGGPLVGGVPGARAPAPPLKSGPACKIWTTNSQPFGEMSENFSGDFLSDTVVNFVF